MFALFFLFLLAKIYNRPDTIFFRMAEKFQSRVEPLLEQAASVVAESQVDPETGFLVDPLPDWYFSKNKVAPPNPRSPQPKAETANVSGKGKEKERTEAAQAEVNGDGQNLLNFLEFGQRVKAKWSNGQYYEATVCLVNRDKNLVQVVFDDGFVEV